MKKRSLLFVLTALCLGLAACNDAPTPSSSTEDEQPASSISSEQSSESSSMGWIDYASDGSVKLNLDYVGHSFWTDGIEQVTLHSTIDGDTAHFTTSTKNAEGETLLKARFYGIDTPESTGKVQPWGKPASKYTSEILERANKKGTIVVSSPTSVYEAPSADSTGSRYVSLVWINESVKNAPIDQLKLLNLMIVENGYSWVKNVADIPDYVDTFYAAETQAKNAKLHLFGTEPDPYFNYGGYKNVSLLDIKNEVVASLKDPSHKNAYDNAKVTVQGAVAGFSNHIVYIQDYCSYVDESGDPLYFDDYGNSIYEDKIKQGILGEYAGINIFVGMSTPPSKFTTIGNYIQVSALAMESKFGFQLTDGTFPTVSYDEKDAQLIYRAKDVPEEHKLQTIEYTNAGLNAAIKAEDYSALNCSVKITDEVTVAGGSDSDSAHVLYTSATDKTAWSVYFTFDYQPDPNDTALRWSSYERFVGEAFLFQGVLGLHSSSSGGYDFDIYPSKSTDMKWVKKEPTGVRGRAGQIRKSTDMKWVKKEQA